MDISGIEFIARGLPPNGGVDGLRKLLSQVRPPDLAADCKIRQGFQGKHIPVIELSATRHPDVIPHLREDLREHGETLNDLTNENRVRIENLFLTHGRDLPETPKQRATP